MGYKLYLDYVSQPCRAVVLLLKLNNIEYEEILLEVFGGETRTENFKKINPIDGVPVLDDNGWILRESVAMMKYLVTKEKMPDHWYPADLQKRMRVEEFISWHHTGLRAHSVMVFLNSWTKFDFARRIHKGAQGGVDEETMRLYVTNLETCLNQIENYFLERNDFLAGDEISLADLFGITYLQQPASVGYGVTRNRPKLAAWMERVKSFLAPSFDDVSQKILEFGGKRKRSFNYE